MRACLDIHAATPQRRSEPRMQVCELMPCHRLRIIRCTMCRADCERAEQPGVIALKVSMDLSTGADFSDIALYRGLCPCEQIGKRHRLAGARFRGHVGEPRQSQRGEHRTDSL